MDALFASAPGWSTLATSVSVACAGEASAPTVQRPVAASYEPCEGVADTNESPAGNASAIVTPVAGLGPRFVARTVNVSVSPTSARGNRPPCRSRDRRQASRWCQPPQSRSHDRVRLVLAGLDGEIRDHAGRCHLRRQNQLRGFADGQRSNRPGARCRIVHALARRRGHEVEPGRQAVGDFDAGRRIGTPVERSDRDDISSPTSTPDEGTVFVTSTSASRFSVVRAVAVLFAVFVSTVVEDASVTFSIGDGPL